jgi:hypothetical protein
MEHKVTRRSSDSASRRDPAGHVSLGHLTDSLVLS